MSEPRSRYPRPEWCRAAVGSSPKTSEMSMFFVQLRQKLKQLKSATKGLWFIQTCVRAFATWASQLSFPMPWTPSTHLILRNQHQAMNQQKDPIYVVNCMGTHCLVPVDLNVFKIDNIISKNLPKHPQDLAEWTKFPGASRPFLQNLGRRPRFSNSQNAGFDLFFGSK